ncbi:MAG: hypothetical protein B6V02_00430 [Thermoprotei archaeon ex4572_64]|nr:MAG: hypothetical protein B6V02_00430 [Thermoprotei archaeon ex4572_64]
MRNSNYVLIIYDVYSLNAEIHIDRRVRNELEKIGYEIANNVVISWKSRSEVERCLLKIKDDIIRRIEASRERAELAYSIIELSDEQYRALRNLVSKRLEKECDKLIRRVENIINKLRACSRDEVKRVRKEFLTIDKEYKRIVNLHSALDVRHALFEKLIHLMRRAYMEFYRRS